MVLQFDLSYSRGRLRLYGVGALAGIVAIFGLPYLFAARMDSATAERLLREYLQSVASQRQMEELWQSGSELPSMEMAQRWQEENRRQKDLTFESIEVKRAWLVPPLRRRSNFIVRVTLREDEGAAQTRYYWFFAPNNRSRIRECSSTAWAFPL